MPTRAVAAETMAIGKKGAGKHWTEAEVKARQDAAEGIKRKTKVKLMPPDWLSKEACVLWNEKIAQVAGLKAANELLDVLDTELLAMYCDAVIQYRELSTPMIDPITKEKKVLNADGIKALQAWSRIIRDCAEKLGFTPSARARLVKKIADKKQDPFGKFD